MQTDLFKKLLNVRKEIKSVKKTGYNSHGGYHYPTEQDIVDSVRELLNAQGILIFTSYKITNMQPSFRVKNGVSEHSGFITSVESTHTFVDTESGQQYTVTSVGQGHDTLGDKGSNKGCTSAFKYFLSKNMLIETNEDAEADDKAEKASSKNTDDFDTPVATQAAAPKAVLEAAPPVAKTANGAPSFLKANKPATAAPKSTPDQGRVVNMTNPEPEF